MTDTVIVRVTDGDVWVDGEHLTRGDEVDIPESVYERIPRSFERVDGENAVDDADAEDSDGDETVVEDTDDQDDSPAEDTDDVANDDTEADDQGDTDEVTPEIDPHPGDLTVDEIEDRVADVDDLDTLWDIRELEAESDERTTALEAIDERIADLEG